MYKHRAVLLGGRIQGPALPVPLIGADRQWLRQNAEAEVKKRTMKALLDRTKIVTAKLADKAGVFGAVGIAIQAGGKSTSKQGDGD